MINKSRYKDIYNYLIVNLITMIASLELDIF